MKVQCPNCQKVQNAPDDSIGKRARCKSCRDTFVIINAYDERVVPDIDPNSLPAKAPRPNFFIRTWSGIPAPFKTAFLATLGVVSALLFTWYVARVPKWLHKSPAAPTTAGRPLADADIPSAQLLTELLHCRDDYAALDTIQFARVAFAKEGKGNLSLWLNSAKPNIAVITQAIFAIDQRPPCTDAGMRLWSSQIRLALLAELRCQEYIASLAEGTRSADAAAIKALLDDAVRRIDLAYETQIIQTARFGVAE